MLPTTYQSTVLPFVIFPATLSLLIFSGSHSECNFCVVFQLRPNPSLSVRVDLSNWSQYVPDFLWFFVLSRDTMPSLSALSQIGYNVKVCWAHLTRNISPINFPLYTNTPPSTAALLQIFPNLLKSAEKMSPRRRRSTLQQNKCQRALYESIKTVYIFFNRILYFVCLMILYNLTVFYILFRMWLYFIFCDCISYFVFDGIVECDCILYFVFDVTVFYILCLMWLGITAWSTYGWHRWVPRLHPPDSELKCRHQKTRTFTQIILYFVFCTREHWPQPRGTDERELFIPFLFQAFAAENQLSSLVRSTEPPSHGEVDQCICGNWTICLLKFVLKHKCKRFQIQDLTWSWLTPWWPWPF